MAEDARLKAEAEEAAKVKAAAEAEAARVKAAAEAAEAARLKAEADARAAEIEAQRKADAAQLAVLAELVEAIDALTTRQAAAAEDEEAEEEEEETPAASDTPSVTPPATTPPAATTPAAMTTATSGEDIRRAHKILAAFDMTADDPDVADTIGVQFHTGGFGDGSPDITVESGRVKVRSGFFKPSGSVASLPGFTAFSLKDDAPIVGGVEEEIWALYTDIEKTRGELEQEYEDRRVVDKPGEFAFQPADFNAANRIYQTRATTISARATRDTFTMSGISNTSTTATERIVSSALISADADEDTDGIQIERAPGSTFSATVRGNSVRAVCVGPGDCTFTIATESAEDATKLRLTESPFTFVNVSQTTGKPPTAGTGAWIFKARSQRQIAIPGGDQEFAYFGWWMQVPDSAEGNYMYRPRYGGMGVVDFPSGVSGRYVGSATGWYVQEDRSKTVTSDGDFLTHAKSGIFTATASLRATSSTDVTGVINKFKEGGASLGNWQVALNNGEATLTVGDTSGGAGVAAISFVPSRVPNEAPVSAVGHFNASIDEVLHLSGAFGAKRQLPTQ